MADQHGRMCRLQQLAGKLQHIAIERVFILLLVTVIAVVLALFFAALYFVHQHRQSHSGCLTTIAAQLAVANGSKIVVQGRAEAIAHIYPSGTFLPRVGIGHPLWHCLPVVRRLLLLFAAAAQPAG